MELVLLSECSYWFMYGCGHAWTEIGAVFKEEIVTASTLGLA